MNRATILVVEDDTNLKESICDILMLQQYEVISARDGQEALDLLRNCPEPPDLIVSDIMMPHMNGYELFEAVRNEIAWVAIPFIFLTAKTERSDILAGKSLGADDYLTKPFDTEELIIAVDAKLRRSKALESVYGSHIASVKRNIMTILNHEFRTPLTYIVAYADMLNRDADDLSPDELKMFLRGINSGAGRLRRLVENFIFLVELETGEAQQTFAWRKGPFKDYGGVIARAASNEESLAQDKGVRVQISLPEQPLPVVLGYDVYLQTAMGELIDNAIKFSVGQHDTVYVSTYADQDAVYLSVKDHGRGIPANELTSIFDVFYQIDRESFEDQGGGSGLAIVKRITELHGGQVAVESTVGEGSIFTIQLPILGGE
jgi:signal transduction histidine kinase